MKRLTQRLVSAGPVDNDTYRRLTKLAHANRHATIESLVGDMLEVMATDDDLHMWVPLALDKEDYDFAVKLWAEDFRVMLDQAIGDALDRERRRSENA